jgi:aspartyl-tRNA(Asn)/glutamyl-tRNA(Gln) amidotransferase subunit B
MRSKEDAMDYRYFPDPDLLPLEISEGWKAEIKKTMPELPQAKRERFMQDYRLPAYDAGLLTQSRAWANYFEEAFMALGSGDTTVAAKHIANWMTGDIAAALNRDAIDIDQCPFGPAALAGMLKRNLDNTLSSKMLKDVFAAIWAGEGDADAIIEARGLKQISDTGAIAKIVDEVIAANPKSAEEYRSGKGKAFNALVGQVMKASKGKANPAKVTEILKKKLAV